jgi:hypothetical protein
MTLKIVMAEIRIGTIYWDLLERCMSVRACRVFLQNVSTYF